MPGMWTVLHGGGKGSPWNGSREAGESTAYAGMQLGVVQSPSGETDNKETDRQLQLTQQCAKGCVRGWISSVSFLGILHGPDWWVQSSGLVPRQKILREREINYNRQWVKFTLPGYSEVSRTKPVRHQETRPERCPIKLLSELSKWSLDSTELSLNKTNALSPCTMWDDTKAGTRPRLSIIQSQILPDRTAKSPLYCNPLLDSWVCLNAWEGWRPGSYFRCWKL